MLGFLKKNKVDAKKDLFSPVTGKTIDITAVPDKVFASKMMGDGIAFQFDGDTLYSPCDGELTMVPATLHAYGFKLANGAEVLVHIGLDTVNLNGEGFTCLVKQGSKVKVGDPIVKIDQAFMKSKGIDLTTPMVVTNGGDYSFSVVDTGKDVSAGDMVIEFK